MPAGQDDDFDDVPLDEHEGEQAEYKELQGRQGIEVECDSNAGIEVLSPTHQPIRFVPSRERRRQTCVNVGLAIARAGYRLMSTFSLLIVYGFTLYNSLRYIADNRGWDRDDPVVQGVINTWMVVWTIAFIIPSTINGIPSKLAVRGNITALIRNSYGRLINEIRFSRLERKVLAGFVFGLLAMHHVYLTGGAARTAISALNLLRNDTVENDTITYDVSDQGMGLTTFLSIALLVFVLFHVLSMSLWSVPNLVDKFLKFMGQFKCCREPALSHVEMHPVARHARIMLEEKLQPVEDKPLDDKPKGCLAKLKKQEEIFNARGYQYDTDNSSMSTCSTLVLQIVRWTERVVVVLSELADYTGSVGTLVDEVLKMFSILDADNESFGIAVVCSVVTVVATTLFIILCQEELPTKGNAFRALFGLWWMNKSEEPEPEKAKGSAPLWLKAITALVAGIFMLTRGAKIFFKVWLLMDDGANNGTAQLGDAWVPDEFVAVFAWMYLANPLVIIFSTGHGVLTVIPKGINAYKKLNELHPRRKEAEKKVTQVEMTTFTRVRTDGVDAKEEAKAGGVYYSVGPQGGIVM